MFRIKRLYTFILQTFLPLFLMTFCICLFIVLMQFLWKHIDDLVGKGLDVSVIAELFFYAALTMVPLALPLAILLASLMVFGNLGEKLELTAMKSAGVSLFRIMMPLIVFVSAISVGAFFFQNDVLPKAQVKMWTLLFSMRQKSPELEIPEGAFYDQIDGYNIFVRQKNIETGMLYGMMIYDVSKGFGTANVMAADSGKLSISEDKTHLFLQLYSGESFEDLRSERGNGIGSIPNGQLYRRETFSSREILIPFDANFNRLGDETMRNQYIGKNMSELTHSIDSINERIDSIGSSYARLIQWNPLFGVYRTATKYVDGKVCSVPNLPVTLDRPMNVDSIYNSLSLKQKRSVISIALSKATRLRQEYEYKGYAMQDDRKNIRRHDIELQKKFTLAIACLIFFFIGAPLGSIIRKGGLAVPIVVSVLLFVIYYIIDNSGMKLAKEGIWEVWQGVWLSSAVLFPVGVFFTWKAVNDSAVFNADAYLNFFRKIFGNRILRNIEMKDVVMDDVVISEAIPMVDALQHSAEEFLEKYKSRQSYLKYWLKGVSRSGLMALSAELETVVERLGNSKDILVIHKLMDYPVLRRLFFYQPSRNVVVSWAGIVLFPIGLPLYFIGLKNQSRLRKEVAAIVKVSKELKVLLEKDTLDKQ